MAETVKKIDSEWGWWTPSRDAADGSISDPRNSTAPLPLKILSQTQVKTVCFQLYPSEWSSAAQSLDDIDGPILRNPIRESAFIDHDIVIDAEIDVPAQRAMFIENIIGQPEGLIKVRLRVAAKKYISNNGPVE